MKRSKIVLAGLGAAAVLGAGTFVGVAASQEQHAPGMQRGMHAEQAHFRGHEMRGRHMRGPGAMRAGMGERLFELYDADKDGKVTQAEVDKTRADRLAKFDTDGDGKLSLKEYEALWLDAMRERMVRQFQSHDRDGDAAVTVEEFQRGSSHLVERLDRNDDGAFSREDRRPRGDRGRGMDRDDDGDRRGRRL